MMSPSLISIIVPVYNVEKYLSECIDSILAQTYSNFELILVNDGSTDSSGTICEAYAQKDSRVIAVHQQNKGASAARNQGIASAKGSHICFIDSDDTVTSHYLDAFLPGIDKGAHLCVQGLQEYINGKITFVKQFENRFYHSVTEALDAGMLHFRGPVCKLFIADIIKQHQIEFPEHIVYGEDAVFYYSYLSHIDSIFTTYSCNYFYRKGIESTTLRLHDPQALFNYLEYSIGKVTELYKKSGKRSPLPDFSSMVELKGLLANIKHCKYTEEQTKKLIRTIRKSADFNLPAFPCRAFKDHIIKALLRWAPTPIISLFIRTYCA